MATAATTVAVSGVTDVGPISSSCSPPPPGVTTIAVPSLNNHHQLSCDNCDIKFDSRSSLQVHLTYCQAATHTGPASNKQLLQVRMTFECIKNRGAQNWSPKRANHPFWALFDGTS